MNNERRLKVMRNALTTIILESVSAKIKRGREQAAEIQSLKQENERLNRELQLQILASEAQKNNLGY